MAGDKADKIILSLIIISIIVASVGSFIISIFGIGDQKLEVGSYAKKTQEKQEWELKVRVITKEGSPATGANVRVIAKDNKGKMYIQLARPRMNMVGLWWIQQIILGLVILCAGAALTSLLNKALKTVEVF